MKTQNHQTSSQFLKDAFARMLMIRRFEEEAVQLTRGDEPVISGSIHCCGGQEAIPVGAMSALTDVDRVIATYRGHGWALECGVTPFELMAEMAHRANGINGGRAGSLLAMAPDRGFVGENSIVGAGGPIACGVALAAKVRQSGGVAIVSFGDGATSQGGLHEAFVTASALNLPVIFMCENNGWAEMTPTTYFLKPGLLAKRAEGYGMRSITIDGGNPLAVQDAVVREATATRRGEGPVLIEAVAPRLWGHYNRDIEHYRPSADRKAAAAQDPIVKLRQLLIADGVSEGDVQAIEREVEDAIRRAVDDTVTAPHPDTGTHGEHVFASAATPAKAAGPVETVEIAYGQAVGRALEGALEEDDNVIFFGEDVALAGGVFGITRGLSKKFGESRVFDTPIAETAIMGTAVGAAMAGLKPVAEIMYADFLFVALDQLVNQASIMRYVSNNQVGVPLVIRTQQGVTPGSCAQHARCVEAFLTHVPGLKVGMPMTPQDAYSMLRAAIADPDPCVIIEARSAIRDTAMVEIGGEVENTSGARLRREGDDIAIISWGTAIKSAITAADVLSGQGVKASVLDLRWLSPLDDKAIEKVVKACGKVLVVHEANVTGGFGAEIAARIAERHSDSLAAPVARLGSIDVPMPASPTLQRVIIPDADEITRVALGIVNGEAAARLLATAG